LKLNLKNLEAGTTKVVLPVKKDEIDAAIAPLEADGTLNLTLFSELATEYIGDACLNVTLSLECSRCLKKIVQPLDLPFSLVLKAGSGPKDDDEDDNVVYFDPHDEEADLTGIIAEEISVNSPMQPLCKENCKGLCPSCGANLNRKACGCKPEVINPAWEALKKLKGE